VAKRTGIEKAMGAERKKGDFIDEESGTVFIDAVRQEVAKAMKGVTKHMDELSEGQKKRDEELAWIKNRLAEVGATARAAAIASAVPIDKEDKWAPLPIERYPKAWVDKHGVVDIAITPEYTHPSITINTFTIPVRPGVVMQVPGNVADALEELGLLGIV